MTTEQRRGLIIDEEKGTVTVPLKGRADVVLEEPSMSQLARAHERVATADASLPPTILAPDDPNQPYLDAVKAGDKPPVDYDLDKAQWYAEQITASRDRSNERSRKILGPEMTYGNAFLDIVRDFSGDDTIDADCLLGWAMSWQTCNRLLTFFTTPLDGRASEQTPALPDHQDDDETPNPTPSQ